jgi:hypothetical protein
MFVTQERENGWIKSASFRYNNHLGAFQLEEQVVATGGRHMGNERRRYIAAGVCILLFIAAQAFQEASYRFWIPASHGPQDDLLAYLLPVDRARAILIAATIVALIVPYAVIALRYVSVAPVMAMVGLVFGSAFIGFEIAHRSMDFFVVGMKWAREFAATGAGPERNIILQRFALWNEMVQGWYFPLMLSFLLASCAFATATWKDRNRGWWYYLAPIAFGLNALRLLGRMLSTFAGQAWLDGLNNNLYFPAVFTINTLLAVWFFRLAGEHGEFPSSGTRPRRDKA